MISALVVMTILGCDDSVSQCHYVSTVKGSWETIASCDAESQKHLPKFVNSNYPVIVAMCDTADKKPDMAQEPVVAPDAPAAAAMAPSPPSAPMPADAAPAAPAAERPALPRRALALLSGTLPDMAKLRAMVSAPVHSVQNGYSWVARRFAD